MSRRRHGMRRKFVAVLTAFALTLSMAAPAFAYPAKDGDGVINYVSLGDSMTNGYCFTGYDQGNISADDFKNGNNVYGEDAYPNQFESWLVEQGYSVNHSKLAVSAMRAEDLNYLLGGREMPTDGWFSQVEDYSGTDGDALKGIYQNAVAEADVITMGIGNASFGAYTVQYFTRMLGVMGGSLDPEERVDLEKALEVLEPEQKAVITDAYNAMMAEAQKYTPEQLGPIDVQELVDLMAYVGAGFILNYEGSLEQIVALNPDVEIVLVGLMNTTYGMEVTGEGFDPVPVGDIVGVLFDALNAYIAGLPTAMQAAGEWEDATFYYAEQTEPEFIVQVFDDLYDEGWPADYEGLSGDTVRARTIKAYNEALRPMIGQALGFNLPAIDIDDVNNYVFDKEDELGDGTGYQYAVTIEFSEQADQYDGTNAADLPLVERYIGATSDVRLENAQANFSAVFAADIEKEISIAIYAALEESLAQSVDTMEITLEGLLGIAGDVLGALGKMPEGINPANNPGPWTIKTELVNWFTGSDTGLAMCKIFALFKVGDGMSVHPTPKAHENIAAEVIEAYETGYTVEKETVKNLGEALEALDALVAEYYDEALAYGYQYAKDNGYVDAAVASLDELNAELEGMKAWVANDDQIPADVKSELIAEIDAAIASVDALTAFVAQSDEDEPVASVDEVAVTSVDTIEVETIVAGAEDVASLISDIETHLANIDALIKAAGADLAELADRSNAAYTKLQAAKPAVEQFVSEALEAATTGEYEITKMSRYAAIGDGTIAGENSYADQFAAELAAIAEAEGGSFNTELQYDKLIVANEDGTAATTEDILAKIESGEWDEAIANADIITLSIGSEDLTVSAKDKLLEVVFSYVDCMLSGEEYQSVDNSDWARYVGEQRAAEIDAAVEVICAELGEVIGDEAAAQMAADVIEGYVWSYVGFATTYADVIDAVQALSPEAEIVVVGLSNVLDGLVLNFGGVEVDLGVYAQYLFKSADLQLLAYAAHDAEGNVTFVSAPEADSDIAGSIAEMVEKFSAVDFSNLGNDTDALMEIAALIGNANLTSTWMPNAEGQAYIFGKIMDAMTITVNPEGADPKDDTVTITLTEGEGYWISATDYEGTSFEVNKGDEVLVWVEADENWCINAVYANGQQIFPEAYDSCAFAFAANEDTVITVDASMMEVSLKRIWGNYANQTSAKISLEAFDAGECDAVVIARDDDFRDAMSASGLAGALGCPIILTDRDGLSASAEEEIARLGVTSAYIIGGKGAMPGDFEAELTAMGLEKVERVFGNQSYDTSVECAKLIAQLNEEDGFSNDYAIVAYGQNFQDALSMSSFAYAYRVPIFLQTFGATSADRGLTDEAINLINTEFCGDGRYSDGILFVAGGEGAVSEESLDGIQLGERVRIGGDDGYETSLMIADYMVSEGYLGAWTVAVCCGALDANGLDALSGSALVGKQGGVILLASEQAAYGAAHMEAVEGFFMNNANDVWDAYILGGQYVMPTSVYNTVADYLNLAHEA